jgi:hypothetical protein
MCGIVGIATNFTNGFNYKETDALRDMLFIDTLRGLDSTGVFGVDKHSNVEILKEATHGLRFIHAPEYKEFQGKLLSAGLFAVGHNRAATRGEVTDKNAHPFWVDDRIILVHNGTVRGDHKKDLKDVEVDSEAIAHLLSEEPDIEKAFKKINSAFALCWFDTRKHTLHLLRNSERPMWWVQGENNGYLWASEEHTLNYVLKKHNIRTKGNPEMLDIHKLMTFEIKGDHYEQAYAKVDTHFTYVTNHNYSQWGKPGNSHHPFRQEYGHGFCGMDVDDDTNPIDTTGGTPTVLQQIAKRKRNEFTPANRDVKVSFSDYAIKYLDDFHVEPNTVPHWIGELSDLKKKDGRVYLEVYDYIPTNSEPGCKSWYVYGAPIHPREENPPIAIYWIVHNKDKDQMKDEIDLNPFWHVRIGEINSSQFHGSKKADGVDVQQKMALVKAYGFDAKSAYEVMNDGNKTEETPASH